MIALLSMIAMYSLTRQACIQTNWRKARFNTYFGIEKVSWRYTKVLYRTLSIPAPYLRRALCSSGFPGPKFHGFGHDVSNVAFRSQSSFSCPSLTRLGLAVILIWCLLPLLIITHAFVGFSGEGDWRALGSYYWLGTAADIFLFYSHHFAALNILSHP